MITLMRLAISRLKPLVGNRYVFFLLFLLSYTKILELFDGLPSLLPAWRFEIPLLFYLYIYLNLITRKDRLQPWIAAGPIILAYGIFDVYHFQFGRLLRITEVAQLPEMFQVISPALSVLTCLLVGLPILALLASLRPRRLPVMAAGGLPLLTLLFAVEARPEFFMETFEKTQKEIVFYSDIKSAANNGRLGMMFYNEARRRISLEKTAAYRVNSPYQLEFDKTIGKVTAERAKRNVHMVVLESFVDPALLRGATYSRNPVHPDFEKLFRNKGGLSISPVFGGGTAQAEFEVLCGVPAMRELSGVEFDVFTGAKTLCLPNVLAQSGYRTVATNAFVPDFFNSTNAYAGIGFSEIYYPSDYAPGRETYFSTGDVEGEKYMFDGVLLAQNLDFVGKWIKENPGKPLFNYVISMYGHTPNSVNLEKRPTLIEMQGNVRDAQLESAVNQYYYRTEALAAYVRELLKVDPKSLIILVSDHLPPLTYGPNTYRDLNYLGGVEDNLHLNRIYFMENGRPVQFSTIHHYDVPRIILNYVTQGKYCQEQTCDFTRKDGHLSDKDAFREEYMTIMARAMDEAETSSAELPVAASLDETAMAPPAAGNPAPSSLKQN
ncbi:MAG: hypothetical protein A2521_12175 [Deltaproteobacteria bacterium RIFOXYD12_FULL_57_12]|nr:MAG: hypothetical protein A2521_12175 [Deltaproteobacteria bacterium RIFOXYD12_FULL_57_12]